MSSSWPRWRSWFRISSWGPISVIRRVSGTTPPLLGSPLPWRPWSGQSGRAWRATTRCTTRSAAIGPGSRATLGTDPPRRRSSRSRPRSSLLARPDAREDPPQPLRVAGIGRAQLRGRPAEDRAGARGHVLALARRLDEPGPPVGGVRPPAHEPLVLQVVDDAGHVGRIGAEHRGELAHRHRLAGQPPQRPGAREADAPRVGYPRPPLVVAHEGGQQKPDLSG